VGELLEKTGVEVFIVAFRIHPARDDSEMDMIQVAKQIIRSRIAA